jgi:cyclin-dependent kinase 7
MRELLAEPAGYTKGDVCGHGTFGTVRAARRNRDGATVAIKKVRGAFRYRTGLCVESLREIKILRHIQHLNVVSLLDVLIHKKESVKLIFQFKETNLDVLLESESFEIGAPEAKALSLMLLRGVAHLHSQQILHRDLKPNNLLIGLDGVLQIADFGRAKHITDVEGFDDPACAGRGGASYTSQLVTLHYRAPELLLGARAYGPAIDVWSCAAIMAEMEFKHRPSPGFFTVETGEHRMHSDIMQFDRILRVLGVPGDRYGWAEPPPPSRRVQRRACSIPATHGRRPVDCQSDRRRVGMRCHSAALDAMGPMPDLAKCMVRHAEPCLRPYSCSCCPYSA